MEKKIKKIDFTRYPYANLQITLPAILIKDLADKINEIIDFLEKARDGTK